MVIVFQVLDYIASPGIVIPLLVLLVLIIYYLLSLTSSLREANNDLKVSGIQYRVKAQTGQNASTLIPCNLYVIFRSNSAVSGRRSVGRCSRWRAGRRIRTRP
jgi:hypothetical protein